MASSWTGRLLDECLCTLCEACDDTDGGASVVAAARYLVTQGGADVNKVRRRDWRGPLHICSVRNLHELGAFLVDAGADVNAVSKDDATPLGLCSEGSLMDVLKARGARTTWRRDAEPTPVPPPQEEATAPPSPQERHPRPWSRTATCGPSASSPQKPRKKLVCGGRARARIAGNRRGPLRHGHGARRPRACHQVRARG